MIEIANVRKYQPVNWNGKIVITTAQLAEVYETDINNIKNNFNNHKENFSEGLHYYLLKGEDLKAFKNLVNDFDLVDKRTPQLYLWTERGANRHCKILDTDKAWEQFDNLEETYFRVKENHIDRSQLDPQMKLMYGILDRLAQQQLETKRLTEQQTKIEKKVDTIAETFSKDTTKDFHSWVKKCIKAIAENKNYPIIGTLPEKYQAVTVESYERLNQKKPCRLNYRVETEKGRAMMNGASMTRINAISKLTIIENDKALRPIYETVLKEMMIAYCVEVAS